MSTETAPLAIIATGPKQIKDPHNKVVAEFAEAKMRCLITSDINVLLERLSEEPCFSVFISEDFGFDAIGTIESFKGMTHAYWVYTTHSNDNKKVLQAKGKGANLVISEPVPGSQFIARARQLLKDYEKAYGPLNAATLANESDAKIAAMAAEVKNAQAQTAASTASLTTKPTANTGAAEYVPQVPAGMSLFFPESMDGELLARWPQFDLSSRKQDDVLKMLETAFKKISSTKEHISYHLASYARDDVLKPDEITGLRFLYSNNAGLKNKNFNFETFPEIQNSLSQNAAILVRDAANLSDPSHHAIVKCGYKGAGFLPIFSKSNRKLVGVVIVTSSQPLNSADQKLMETISLKGENFVVPISILDFVAKLRNTKS